MQKFTKTTRTLAALLVSGTALSGVASAAEISANFGATTDYIWRGMTQNGGSLLQAVLMQISVMVYMQVLGLVTLPLQVLTGQTPMQHKKLTSMLVMQAESG